MSRDAFVFTSNVDGQFQKAGVAESRVYQCHGSIHALQCLDACTGDTCPTGEFHLLVNEATSELASPMPRCPHCGALARPNILMFADWTWVDMLYEKQREHLGRFLQYRSWSSWSWAQGKHCPLCGVSASGTRPSGSFEYILGTRT
jgi:NAD-dependent SIR2 family protein deacetylase